MSNESPDHESGFEKGFGFAAGVLMFLFCCLIAVLLGTMLVERFGPPSGWLSSRPTVAVGTPGSGYVPGAPRNAQECIRRGGTVVYSGRGCEKYR